MNTPRTVLEECLRQIMAKSALCQEFIDAEEVVPEAIIDDLLDLINTHGKALSEALGGEPTAADVVAWRYKFYDSGWILSDDDTDIQRIIRNGMPLQRLIVHPDDIPPPPTSAKEVETENG